MYSRSPTLTSQTIGDEVVLLDLEAGRYFGLDEVGAVIWDLAGQGADDEAIIRAIVDAFDVKRDRAKRDVMAFLDELQARGLLRRDGS